MVFTYTPAALEPTAELIRNLEPLVKGEPLAPAEIEQKLAAALPAARHAGPRRDGAGRDRHGAVGRAGARCTACRWCGCWAAWRSRSALRRGRLRRRRTVSRSAAEDWAARGFTGVKAKIGYPTVQEDVAVVRAMREGRRRRRGDHGRLQPVPHAGRGGRSGCACSTTRGSTWVEEPTLAHDYAGHALVAREARTPIQCGENWWGTLDLQHAIDAQASDYVMPDVMKIGGVTGWLRAAALAHAHGLRGVQPPVAGDQRAAAVRARRRRTGWNTPTGGTRSSREPLRDRERAWRVVGGRRRHGRRVERERGRGVRDSAPIPDHDNIGRGQLHAVELDN